MTKRQLIEEIRRHNTSVGTQFLAKFDESSLRLYLERLTLPQRAESARLPRRPVKAVRLRKVS